MEVKMRRLVLLATACSVSLLAGAVPAAADNGPHVAGQGPITDSCAGCHRIHTGKAPHLLKEAQSDLCYTCHGSSATGANNDVEDGVGYSGEERSGGPAGALRGGGFAYALIESDNPTIGKSTGVIPVRGSGQPVNSTHSVDSSEQTAWGFGPVNGEVDYGKTLSMSCGNCHDPHGNGNYRILRTTPRGLYHYPNHPPEEDEVAIPDTETKVYTTSNYWRSDDENALGFAENVAAWCTTCHNRYLADHEGSTDSGDAVYTYRHTSDATGQGGGQRNCVQCHVAHGSNSSMSAEADSVPFPDGSGAGEGDSRLLRLNNRGVCQMCHNK
jgi:predicted CXXCH cytochrome family protein